MQVSPITAVIGRQRVHYSLQRRSTTNRVSYMARPPREQRRSRAEGSTRANIVYTHFACTWSFGRALTTSGARRLPYGDVSQADSDSSACMLYRSGAFFLLFFARGPFIRSRRRRRADVARNSRSAARLFGRRHAPRCTPCNHGNSARATLVSSGAAAFGESFLAERVTTGDSRRRL